MTVSDFEAAAYAQEPTAAEYYDPGYFSSSWRADGNDYTLETRRRIEGQHPALIRDVFAPTRVLDLGCGPGTLMHFLAELEIEVYGIDFSPSSLQLASDLVRDRILIGTTDAPLKPARFYDLVICREVLEHLTVLQIRRTVANMVRMSSRYVYCTTRFHPNPSSLTDFTTQFDVDPTHITLLNKDFLRLLFVLEGCRARPDLEARMDWQGKNRCLVYERV